MEKGFDRGENGSSLFFVESQDFFLGFPDFPLPRVGRSDIMYDTNLFIFKYHKLA